MARHLNPSDIAAVPEPVSACPLCASIGMRMATSRDGFYEGGGALLASACTDCGFVGQPIVFRRRADYARFAAEIAPGHGPS